MAKDQDILSKTRRRLDGLSGKRFWRSLEELAETEEFRGLVEKEYPRASSLFAGSVSRREFLRLMAASLALAGLGACGRKPEEEIVPYVLPPEEVVPGKPLYFATAFLLGGFATGILVESHEGRPTKIEGNPEHPASLGATNIFAQAAILELYDPERSQVVLETGRISTWDAFMTAAQGRMETWRGRQGAALRLLTGGVTSPTLALQIRALLQKFPQAKWCPYEPVSSDNARRGSELAFGVETGALYHFDRADVILALDSDFLFSEPGSVRYARDFSSRRRVRGEQVQMNRLYAAEPTPTITGSMADHRLSLTAGWIEPLAAAVARRLGIDTGSAGDAESVSPFNDWIEAVAADLRKHRGSSLVVAGAGQPPRVHALAHAMNDRLGNAGRTVIYTEPVAERPAPMESLEELVQEMRQGAVEDLFILGGNPVFTAPADLGFAEALRKVPFSVHLGLYEDETSYECRWHVPATHFLESWGDAKSFDGTVTVVQPLIAPLYRGKSVYEVLSFLIGPAPRSGYDIVRNAWRSRIGERDFESWWRRILHDGVVPGTAAKPVKVAAISNFDFSTEGRKAESGIRHRTLDGSAKVSWLKLKAEDRNSLEIVFRPDPTIWDGSFANNGWLQELPKPITKLTWDNAALISPRTAEKLGLTSGDAVELRFRDHSVTAPVWITPGQAEESVTVHFGYGRSRTGRVGLGAGFNAYRLRLSDQPWFDRGLQMRKTGERIDLATTQHHHRMEGRHLVRTGTLDEYRHDPDFVHEMGHEPAPGQTLYPEHPIQWNAWGMAIDTNVCIGCNACVAACQAENNIPVVGKQEVAFGREMHWIRVDRYYEGPLDDPEILYQPVPCMHCENAPCEPVCPVGATVHSSEGLNEMVYNRCVGTRYCSNNCPYKVRRFNFYQYADFETPILKIGRNPDVSVRSRGVMEKCTYCVQRINQARIEAKKENRPIRDGEIRTACQQVCPTQAIIFGDMKDPDTEVSRVKREPLNYTLLAELNTRPRTSYLARLRNPNGEIKSKKAKGKSKKADRQR